MEILSSLGIDSTLWIHFACFLVSYVVFTQLVLKPYGAALREREKRTIGNEEAAVRMIDQASDLSLEYEKKARAMNAEMKAAYNQSRTEAMREYDRLVQEASKEAAVLLEKSRAEISTQIRSAKEVLSKEVPAVSAAIASKLAGKEISV